MKLDAAKDDLIKQIDQPEIRDFTADKLISQLTRFNGKLIIQSIFLTGEHNGVHIDNTGDENVMQWIEALKKIHPEKVMIYTISRDTPVKTLRKAPAETLENIAEKVKQAGFDVSIST
jgi:wyosine [tRNA(Phe)-imidazoG37] synthetase (radical SAM superfamily)